MTDHESVASDSAPHRSPSRVFGSDVLVDAMQAQGIEDAVINPGASISGLHESLERSSMSLHLALHENVALAVADGYSRVTGKPMAVILHNLVGLQSGTMGVFNAWVNQSPVCIYGGAGPESWVRRRPWIDWVHSAKPQTAGIQNEVKWHAQPADVASAVLTVHKGHRIAAQSPQGPTYVAFDVAIQEDAVTDDVGSSPEVETTADFSVSDRTLGRLVVMLHEARRPVIVADLVGRSQAGFDALRQLAELVGAPVVDLAGRHNFDTAHSLSATHHRAEVLSQADIVLALDCRDLNYGILAVGHRDETHHRVPAPDARIVDISLRSQIPGHFVDYASTETEAWTITADTETLLPVLVDRVRELKGHGDSVAATVPWWSRPAADDSAGSEQNGTLEGLSLRDLASVSWEVLRQHEVVVANGDLRGWLHAEWELTQRLSFLGKNLGAGLGYGSGASSGAAIGLRRLGSEAIVVNFQNDGDFLYTPQALWTQARYSLPVLTFVVNNGSYGQDRRHSERLAKLRGRVENAKPEGIDFDTPPIDFGAIASAQGLRSWGAVTDRKTLEEVTLEACRYVTTKRLPALIDVKIVHEPRLVTL